MLKSLKAVYHSADFGRKPLMIEVLETVAFVLRPLPSSYLDAGEARELMDICAEWRDERGMLPLDDALAALAVALRRNAGKLGDLVESGSLVRLGDLEATTKDGRSIKLSCATTKADSFVVDDLSEMLAATSIAFKHGEGRLPTMDEMTAAIRGALDRRAERYDVSSLGDLRVTFAIAPPGSQRGAGPLPAAVRVRHPKFGDGVVLRTIEDGERKLEIQFSQGGTRTLLARFVETLPPAPKE
jgi:hypothetical protein